MRFSVHQLALMSFSRRLATARKQKGWTQQQMAEVTGIHVSQIKRYESGETQASIEVLRKLAIALSVTTDALLFDDQERGPSELLKLQFETIARMPPEEQTFIREVLEGLILKYQAKRWAQKHVS